MSELPALARASWTDILSLAVLATTAACGGSPDLPPRESSPVIIPGSVPPEVRPDPASTTPAPGCEPSNLTPGPLMETACQDASLPRFSGTLGGVQFAPETADRGEHTVACSARATRLANFADMAGTPLDIFAAGLPEGFVDAPGERPVAWECDGRVVTADRLVVGGHGALHIIKYLRPTAWIEVSAPVSRLREVAVARAPGALVLPVFPGTEAHVLFADPHREGYVLTWLIGFGGDTDELVSLAEALRASGAPAGSTTCPLADHEPRTFTVITTSRPWCARWVDQWDNETGFLLELRYLGAAPDRSGGETFEYRLPPNTTEHAIPEADMPGAAGTGACLARNDAEFKLYVELPAGRLEASSASLLGLCR